MHQQAEQIFWAGVQAVRPENLLPRHLQRHSGTLTIGGVDCQLESGGRVVLAAAGKAAAAMAQVGEEILGDVLSGGLVVTKYGHSLPLKKLPIMEAGHPIPDSNSLLAAEELTALLRPLGENDVLIFLLSGGASALLQDVPPGCSLADVQEMNSLLLACGADIAEINTIRKHLSPGIKGGRLAKTAFPARLFTLIISDVPGDSLSSIASGPTVPDSSAPGDAWQILDKYHLHKRLPPGIRAWLEAGNPSPAAGDPVFSRVQNFLIGSNAVALSAAAAEARRLGRHTIILTDRMQGEARNAGAAFVQELLRYDGPRPACLLMGGETTVTLKGSGKGGRNQEFVLAALQHLLSLSVEPAQWPVILSAGTDGSDGPTDAAGAEISPLLYSKLPEAPQSVSAMLDNNDAYHFFEATGGLLITGPTQTNVMDLVLGLLD